VSQDGAVCFNNGQIGSRAYFFPDQFLTIVILVNWPSHVLVPCLLPVLFTMCDRYLLIACLVDPSVVYQL